MQKKSRAERRREKFRGNNTKPFLDALKPFLSLKHPVTGFCLTFVGLLLVFSFLIFQTSAERLVIHPFTGFIAAQAAWLLKMLGMRVTASGISIAGEGFSVEILGNCNAIFEMGLFLSAVIAFPATIKEKAVGGILGTAFIYCLNLLRVVLLFLVGVYAPHYFEESHVYVSQTLFIAVVALFWLLWAGKWVKGTVQ